MKKKKTVAVAILIVMLLVLATGCVSAKAETVKIGNEEVATLYTVVGEKKITGSSVNTNLNATTTELTYTGVSLDELNEYITKLAQQDGFMITQQTQTDETGQSYQLGKQASEADKILLINFHFGNDGSTVISYTVGKGEITPEV